MTESDLRDFLLQLGKCFYRSTEYRARFGPGERIDSVSEFGIGFASSFLVGYHVVLETKATGEEAVLLDMYDLMGFVAARPSSKSAEGTTVLIHLKEECAENVKNAVSGVRNLCPHVEFPIVTQVDGVQEVVECQRYCREPNELLVPYFRDREPGFVIEHRHFDPETEGISGCISMMLYRQNGIMVPGGPEHYKLEEDEGRRVSQLGFRLPDLPTDGTSLLGSMRVACLGYDLDLRGDMRLELDASRSRILGSEHNQCVLRHLDEYLVAFVLNLHARHWQQLSRDQRFDAYDALGKQWFARLMDPVMFWHQTACSLVELLFDNMPLETIAPGSDEPTRMTWNEIRRLSCRLVFYPRYRYGTNHESRLQEVRSAIPGVAVVVEDPSYQLASRLLLVCSEVAIHVSDPCQQLFQVVEPWAGPMDELSARYRDPTNRNPWGFLLPFVPPTGRALVSSTALRRSGGVHAWVNAAHPKISRIVRAAQAVGAQGHKTPACSAFLRSLHERHYGSGTDPDYVAYVREHQLPALQELLAVDAIKDHEVQELLLTTEDFVPWERGAV
jgi:hypothetical protein